MPCGFPCGVYAGNVWKNNKAKAPLWYRKYRPLGFMKSGIRRSSTHLTD